MNTLSAILISFLVAAPSAVVLTLFFLWADLELARREWRKSQGAGRRVK